MFLKQKTRTGHNIVEFNEPKPLSSFIYETPEALVRLILSPTDLSQAYALKHSQLDALLIYPNKIDAETLFYARVNAQRDYESRIKKRLDEKRNAEQQKNEHLKAGLPVPRQVQVTLNDVSPIQISPDLGMAVHTAASQALMINMPDVENAVKRAKARCLREFGGIPLKPVEETLVSRGFLKLVAIIDFKENHQ